MMKENLKRVITYYGKDSQKMKAVELLMDLQGSIVKELNGEEVYPKQIQEGIANVHVMLNELLLIYGISDSAIDAEVGRTMKRKMERISA